MMSFLRMWLVVAAVALWSCTNPPPGSPPRPTRVPTTAIWTGGVDGGEFLVFGKKASDPKLVYDAVIYHDFTGEVLFKGKLKLSAPGEIDPRFFQDPKFFDGWDLRHPLI
jgi:hypothetical protein